MPNLPIFPIKYIYFSSSIFTITDVSVATSLNRGPHMLLRDYNKILFKPLKGTEMQAT